MIRRNHWWLAVPCVCLLSACGQEPPKPSLQVSRERESLTYLYLTDKTATRVMAPGDRGLVFVDPGTNEICYRAKVCTNPDCPGKQGDEPFLFVTPDPALIVKPDGTIGADPKKAGPPRDAQQRLIEQGLCPECVKKNNLADLSDDELQKYLQYVQEYLPPEAAARAEELRKSLQTQK
ncbi:MAG: hypothetical protein AB7K24_14030 [Gemmataceae bacterium]